MKILFLSAANSIHTVKWVNALADRGHEVYLVYNRGHEPECDKIRKNVHLQSLKYGGAKGYYFNASALKKITRRVNPDVINVHYASGYGTLARKSKIGPILLSVWGSDVYDFPYESFVKKIILQKNIRYASKLASTSFCMAEQLRRVMGNKELEIAVTPFGVDTEVFNSSRFDKKKKDFILLGNIKMLKPKYGIAEFIRAVKLLLEKLEKSEKNYLAHKLKVHIYGEGEQRQELEGIIKELSLEQTVFLKGHVPNSQVPEILNDFDVFCATSMLDSESFGVAVVEAMAMGVPVIASDVDGFKEVVADGKTGIIVPRGDEVEISQALERLVLDENLRNEFGENGRKRVEQLFDFQKNVDTMEKLYHEMIGLE